MDEFTVECSMRVTGGVSMGSPVLGVGASVHVGPFADPRLPVRDGAGDVSHQTPRLTGWLYGRASGFNAADEVTGEECNAHGDAHAFLWKNDGNPVVDLGPPEVGSYSEGDALNASGLVAGDAQDSTGQFAFLSSGNGTPMTRIYDGLGGSDIYPAAMNDLGQLTGYAYTAGDSVYHAFLWKNDGSPLLDLGTLGGDFSNGAASTLSGQVAGSAQRSGNTVSHAFVWKNDGTTMHDLGTLGGGSSYACCINASGQVAGVSHVRRQTKTRRSHAFFWRNDGTPMQDLGTLGGAESFAYAFNDAGQVAGSRTQQEREIRTRSCG